MGLSLSVPSTPRVSRATATVVKSHRLYNYDPFLIQFASLILWQQNLSISNLQHPTDTAPLWVRPFPTLSTNQAARPCPADHILPHPHGTQNASLSGQHPYPMGCWVRPSLCGQPSVTECPCSTSAPFHASANVARVGLHFLLPVVYRPRGSCWHHSGTAQLCGPQGTVLGPLPVQGMAGTHHAELRALVAHKKPLPEAMEPCCIFSLQVKKSWCCARLGAQWGAGEPKRNLAWFPGISPVLLRANTAVPSAKSGPFLFPPPSLKRERGRGKWGDATPGTDLPAVSKARAPGALPWPPISRIRNLSYFVVSHELQQQSGGCGLRERKSKGRRC